MNEILRAWWQSEIEPLRKRVEAAIDELDAITRDLEQSAGESRDQELCGKIAATRKSLVTLRGDRFLNGADQLIGPLEQQLSAQQKDLEMAAITAAIGKLVEKLLENEGANLLALGGDLAMPAAAPAPGGAAPAAAPAEAISPEDMPWIESTECTSCDDCTTINRSIFAYDENKLAYIKDPRGGPFRDIVKAAEKCPSGIIHPGKPLNPKEKDLAKWVKRAEKYQ